MQIVADRAPSPESVVGQLDRPLAPGVLVDHLVADLTLGRIQSLAFVVPSDVSMTLPLYDVAIATARRGWRIGIEEVRYWLVTPEPEPLARLGTAVSVAASQRLEPEGIAFVGSTYPDVRHGLVLLDPQGESIEVDVVVSLGHGGGFDVTSDRRFGRRYKDGTTSQRDGAEQACRSVTGELVHPL